jgi:hypothetical protein
MTGRCGWAGIGGQGRTRAWGSKAAVVVGCVGAAARVGRLLDAFLIEIDMLLAIAKTVPDSARREHDVRPQVQIR